jgi:hypothetical protein
MRKDKLPIHIKLKHVEELAQHLVEDAKNSSINVISSYMRGVPTIQMPVLSRVHPETVYWFGVRPIMFEEKDSQTSYVNLEANMEAHKEFLTEVMDNISLNDYISIQRNMIVRSKEMMDMKDRVKDAEEAVSTMRRTHTAEMEKMSIELEAHRKTIEEVNDGILHTDLYATIEKTERSLKWSETYNTRLTEEAHILRQKLENAEASIREAQYSGAEAHTLHRIEMEKDYMNQIEALRKSLRKERERSESAKRSDKSNEKTRSEKEKMKKQIKEAKRRLKALESSSESESDSD